ncbi:MAG: 3-dehydroquinate synthase [Planctomycetaceae bacterium]
MQQEPYRFETPLATPSPYVLGEGLVGLLPAELHRLGFDRCFLVTSRKLFELWGRDLVKRLRRDSVRATVLLVGDGEDQKSWRVLQRLSERLVQAGATRDSLLLALGGGVIGNVAGMAAGLLYRGIRFVELPTTVMALTDSTLSNKQAVNGRRGKNLFGLYHAPRLIWGDVAWARSEPLRQQRSGVVEGIKNVFISQSGPAGAEAILDAWDQADLPRLVRLLIESKFPILRADPTEKGSAVILEYGHTFGHAIEFLAQGRLFHGEAVAIGMCLAGELSHALGHLPASVLADHYHLLGDRLGAPTAFPDWLEPESLLQAMQNDNKRTRQGLGYLLLKGYGEFVNPAGDRQIGVESEIVLETLRRAQARSRETTPASR